MQLHFRKNAQAVETLLSGILLLLIMIIPFNEGGNGHIIQLITQCLLLLGAIIWAIYVLRRGSLTLIVEWIDLFIAGFLTWSLISLIISEYKYTTMLELIKLGSYAALFYLLRVFFPLKQRQTWLLTAILISSALQCVVAWGLFLAQRTRVLQADFVNPNNFAQFLVFGVNIALSFVLFVPNSENDSGKKAFLQKVGISLLLIGLTVTILAVKSRGAFISLVGTGLFLTTLKKKQFGMFFLLLCCVLIFLPTPWGSVFQKLQKRDDPFAYERIGIWQSSIRMAIDHPVFGVGLGMYEFYGMEYNFPVEHQISRYGKYLNVAHSDLLQVATELGIVGFLLFLGAIGYMMFFSVSRLREQPPAWSLIAVVAGLIGIVIHGLFSTLLTCPALALIGCIFVGILIDDMHRYRQKTLVFQPTWSWYGASGLLIFYLLVPVIGYPFLAHHHYLRYFTFREQRDIPQAVLHLKQAIRYVPIHAGYHRTFGELYLAAFRNAPNLDAFYESYQAFTRAIRCNARDEQAYEKLGNLHREMFYKKLRTRPTAQNALDAYQHALQYKPYNPFILSTMAALHADLNEFDPAIALLQRAVTIEPNFVGGFQMLGNMFLHLGRQDEAQQAFQQAQAILRTYQHHPRQSDYEQMLLKSLE
ncbi:hypothetical protein U27_06106 [Candidatus Vecturithrix granuli]|uniref:O-antigen ligase-related domain-containing protein n=1 Tax=Vecturithrix granuli TaxID=1499967 RepID=A0A081C3H5_VECG1|nr:hypothetical protein U27_06106 [Candidatus Vecturithrix granuli]